MKVLPMSKASLLLVDDDRQVLTSMADWLRGQGYELDTGSNASEGITRLSQRHYDVALVDIRLGDRDGFELLPGSAFSSSTAPARWCNRACAG